MPSRFERRTRWLAYPAASHRLPALMPELDVRRPSRSSALALLHTLAAGRGHREEKD